MKAKPLPSIRTIRELLDYDAATGVLRWRPRSADYTPPEAGKKYPSLIHAFNHNYAGNLAFQRRLPNGYLTGVILDRRYLAHRIAFAHFHGFEPDHVDHINGDKTDNRIVNLRSVTKRVNSSNRTISSRNTSGVTGVHRHKNKWRATIRIKGKAKMLGDFDTIEMAAAARSRACAENGYIDRY